MKTNDFLNKDPWNTEFMELCRRTLRLPGSANQGDSAGMILSLKSLGRNADQLVSLAGHQVHSKDVPNPRRVVLILERIGFQRRGFL